MSRRHSRIERLAQALAEGKRVDWSAVRRSVLDSNECREVEQLRAVEELAREFANTREAFEHRASGPDAGHATRRFTTTEWSLVLIAGAEDSPASRRALESLCSRYWYPIYAEVRFAGRDAEDARDLTQGFFLHLLERRALAVATPERGKFRNFLKTSIKNYLSNEAARVRARKRGGDGSVISLDLGEAERQYAAELAHEQTPETIFDRRWARALLEQVLRRLRDEMSKGGSREQYERLLPLLIGKNDTPRYKDLAIRWNTSEAAIKMAVHRLRRRLRTLLREEVAHTVRDPEGVNEEIRFLLSAIES